jgi:hypothetical protein
MTLEMLNLMTIPALGALGLWLEGIGGNHGFADKFSEWYAFGLLNRLSVANQV